MSYRTEARGWMMIGLMLCAAPWATAGVIRHDRPQQSYLDLGSSAAYASVGRIDTNAWIGSGTLIAPDWVLTAGHVVNGVKSLNFTVGGSTYSGKQLIKNPSWSSTLSFGYDLALVQLTSSVSNIAPAARYYGSSELGKTATLVGFGSTGTGTTGMTGFDGKKRAGQNAYDKITAGGGASARLLMYDFDNPTKTTDNVIGSSTPLNLEYLIANGDSGGGSFININGANYLAGVHSYGSAVDGLYNSDYGDYAADVRVSAFNSWIDAVLGTFGAIPGYKSAAVDFEGDSLFSLSVDLSQFVPEPSGLLTLGLLGLSAVRRREVR